MLLCDTCAKISNADVRRQDWIDLDRDVSEDAFLHPGELCVLCDLMSEHWSLAKVKGAFCLKEDDYRDLEMTDVLLSSRISFTAKFPSMTFQITTTAVHQRAHIEVVQVYEFGSGANLIAADNEDGHPPPQGATFHLNPSSFSSEVHLSGPLLELVFFFSSQQENRENLTEFDCHELDVLNTPDPAYDCTCIARIDGLTEDTNLTMEFACILVGPVTKSDGGLGEAECDVWILDIVLDDVQRSEFANRLVGKGKIFGRMDMLRDATSRRYLLV